MIMSLIIQKYGGSSLGNIDRIHAVADRILATRAQGHDVVVVVSAMAGETDRLIHLAQQIQSEPASREYAVLLSSGEQASIALIAMALISRGQAACSFTASQVRILTDNRHQKARITGIEDRAIRANLAAGQVVVVAGFQGVSESGDVTTLGRGGSDATAVALAAAMHAKECQIFTDVDGVYSADPRVIPEAQLIPEISYEEMLAFASHGAKVMQNRAVELAAHHGVPLRVASSFGEGEGTLLTSHDVGLQQARVTGITWQTDGVLCRVSGLPSEPGLSSALFAQLMQADVAVDFFREGQAEDGLWIEGLVSAAEQATVQRVLETFGLVTFISAATISLVGRGLHEDATIMQQFAGVLASQKIAIWGLQRTDHHLTVLLDMAQVSALSSLLHTAFA
ncbi:MAG: aspartokinase [marine bacterium B5-7]|nr:MAG: aspartokinase [marine bacterium B5-7]